MPGRGRSPSGSLQPSVAARPRNRGAAMEPRRPRGAARATPRPQPRRPPAAQLWLFPGAPGLHGALRGRAEATRQLCCSPGRLTVLERGGAGVEVHRLPARSDGAGKPKCLKLGKKMKIHSMDQGVEHMLVLSSDGKVFEYSYSIEPARFQSILHEKDIIHIACGYYHSLALSKGGELFAWGQNVHGQLGVGRMFPSTPTPQAVQSLTGVPLVQISAGEAHSMALSMSGNVYSWGRNDCGQLGLGHTENTDSPSLVDIPDNQKVEFLACGGAHTALLTQDGLMFTFGAGKYGQLGHNSTENELRPCLVTEFIGNRVTQIACGRWHTLAYVSDLGKVFSFGFGEEGQLGHGGKRSQLIPLPMKSPSNEELQFESHHSGKELIMIAGGNQSILLWVNKENSYVNLRRKILTLNEGTIKRWIDDVGTKQWQNTRREIREIFSYAACLTGSFLVERGTGETISIDVDLQMARETFKKLTENELISSMIVTCLEANLLRALPCHSPHQEALLIFLLLPECPVMHDSNNWENLVIPFAQAVCNLNDRSSRILKQYWASLEASSLNTLVQMLKSAIISELPYITTKFQSICNIKTLLEMMKEVHEVNKSTRHLPEGTFNIDELSDLWSIAAGEILSFWAVDQVFDDHPILIMFTHFSFVCNLQSKIKLLHVDSSIKMRRSAATVEGKVESPTLILRIRRSHLVEDALHQLSQVEETSFLKTLVVEFIKEIRPESGGVTAEFFHCIFEEMTHPKYGMFMYPEEGSCMWFPVNPKCGNRYFLFGMLCGLSLFNFNIANIPFPLALYKKLLGQNPSLEDLKELSPFWGKSLQEIINDEADDIKELHMYFSIPWDQNDVDLIPDGISVPVDQTNKKDYVSKCVDYIFNISIKRVYEEFHNGFYRVFDQKIIKCFQPEELMTAVIGSTNYDWEAFEKNSQYEQGYHISHPTILTFWKVFHKLTLDEKKKFLLFLTGRDRLHVGGIQNRGIVFRCPATFSERDYPRSLTCHSVLYLPQYSTMERMEEVLHVAINNHRGFAPPGILLP
ncbi:PREDICTED: E3 ISG15--protein ligase HERC5-like [Chinchilla lanigera]|uniref:E3 ISG15--protein ligase HERC5-like n=1 Tax=Chinchilla lanigera TaxID=34839 RepID=UPI000698EA8D|nr:PREDICTED: E3 ISG15--protein ligase HERC5-like [Chinchilla lanigera]